MDLHYALSRALLLFVQEKGSLTLFYSELRKRDEADCSKTLERSLGMKISEIDEEFRSWIMRGK